VFSQILSDFPKIRNLPKIFLNYKNVGLDPQTCNVNQLVSLGLNLNIITSSSDRTSIGQFSITRTYLFHFVSFHSNP